MEQALFSNGESEVVRIGMKKKIKGGGVERGRGGKERAFFPPLTSPLSIINPPTSLEISF